MISNALRLYTCSMTVHFCLYFSNIFVYIAMIAECSIEISLNVVLIID